MQQVGKYGAVGATLLYHTVFYYVTKAQDLNDCFSGCRQKTRTMTSQLSRPCWRTWLSVTFTLRVFSARAATPKLTEACLMVSRVRWNGSVGYSFIFFYSSHLENRWFLFSCVFQKSLLISNGSQTRYEGCAVLENIGISSTFWHTISRVSTCTRIASRTASNTLNSRILWLQ